MGKVLWKKFRENKVILHIVRSLLFRLIGALTTVIIMGFLAQTLTKEDFGAYVLINSLVLMLLPIAQMGQNRLIVKQLSMSISTQTYDSISSIISVNFFISILMLMVITIGLNSPYFLNFLNETYGNQTLNNGLLFASGWLVLTQIKNLSAEGLRGLGKASMASAYGGALTGATLLILLVWANNYFEKISLYLVFQLTLLVFGVVAVFAVYQLLNNTIKFQNFSQRISKLALKENFSLGFSIMASNALIWIGLHGTNWVVGSTLGIEETATFGAVLRLADLLILPSMVMASVGTPLISSFWSQKRLDLFETTTKSVAGIGFAATCLICLFYALFSQQIITLVYGEAFLDGTEALIWLSLSWCIFIFSGPAYDCFSMTKYQFSNILVAIIFMPLVLLFTYIGALKGGINGAAIGIFLAQLVRVIASTYYMYRCFKHNSFPSLSINTYKTFINSWSHSKLQ